MSAEGGGGWGGLQAVSDDANSSSSCYIQRKHKEYKLSSQETAAVASSAPVIQNSAVHHVCVGPRHSSTEIYCDMCLPVQFNAEGRHQVIKLASRKQAVCKETAPAITLRGRSSEDNG